MLLLTLKRLLLRPAEKPVEALTDRVFRLLREKHPDEARNLLTAAINIEDPDPELLSLLGETEYHLKHPEGAEQLFMHALRLRPGLPNAHYGLSLVYYSSNRYFDALAQAQYACNLSPKTSRYLAQLGLCQIATKSYGPARDVLRNAVLLDPDNVPALNNFAIALHALGDEDEALCHIRRALFLNPEYEPARNNLAIFLGNRAYSAHFDAEAGIVESRLDGIALHESNLDLDSDITMLEAEFSRHPTDPTLSCQLIEAYLRALRTKDAMDVLRIALAHHPDQSSLLLLKARIAQQMDQLPLARDIYSRVLEQDPAQVTALLGMGQVLRDLDKVNDALEFVERAAALSDKPETLIQLAFAYSNACRYPEALATCDRVEALQPAMAPFLVSSRAVSHAYLGHFGEAMIWIEKAQLHEATSAGFQVFRGMLQLQNDRFSEGWEGYRHRALLEPRHQRLLPYPAWRGEDLVGKTVLVLAEQGLGDQVMFASCLPDLLAMHPGQVLLEANERVEKTLARSFPQIRVFSSKQRNFDWMPAGLEPDYYLPIADLPYHFRRSVDAFPDHQGYLTADPERVAYWRSRLGTDRPAIGFTWRGGLQKTRQAIRSLELDQLVPVLAEPRVRFVNLQYGNVTNDLDSFSRTHGLEIESFPEAIENLDDFAALVKALDLVITVCNTTVHYTGALGKPCWVLTPHVPEWRYGVTAPRMHWYPSTRMFRQPSPGDWTPVISEVHAALAYWLDQRDSYVA
ncbi:MAG TPA: tetratricopeptide repeat protein [Thiobacillaceae bacterium]|nr:tetratricopeptide repeat protein [Thiobacillaceae bacterium]HNG54738.1 tetratricopeptide repeat protein [Nitrospira sp.]HNH88725.1 tetratricopeptide repeat protein [Thiobacillaceae bacterium]HNI07133.1 tetratricopeptide repeat protein [Thiobacillaceae bacterium]